MKTYFLVLVALIFAGNSVGFAQIRERDRMKQKMEAAEKEADDSKKSEQDSAANKAKWPPARMNIDVQMVLTKLEYKTFAEAKPFAVSRVADGDPLWLYIKFNGTLERYAYTMQDPDGTEHHVLFAEIGPQGDVTAKAYYTLEFGKDELKLSELKLSLSPGKPGHNNSIPLFIRTAGNGKPGLWNNELRLTNIVAEPLGPNDHLAKVGVIYDFSGGVVKYRKMLGEYDSMALRGTTDETKLPVAGKFDDAAVRAALASQLKAENITPDSVYFTDDNWAEYSEQPFVRRQTRSIWAAFTYKTGKDCRYGVANIQQAFDPMNNRFGPSTINLKKDIVTACQLPK